MLTLPATKQGTLFNPVTPVANEQYLSRRDDPETSRDGERAARFIQGPDQREVLRLLALHPDSTQAEIDHYAGNKKRKLGKRFHELETDELIEIVGTRICRVEPSKVPVQVYRLKEQQTNGEAALACPPKGDPVLTPGMASSREAQTRPGEPLAQTPSLRNQACG